MTTFTRFNRRRFLTVLSVSLAWMGLPSWAAAVRPEAFAKEDYTNSIASLFGGGYTPSEQVFFKAPEIAENGAVVPVTIRYPEPAKRIAVFVEANLQPLTVVFNLSPNSVADVSTRIKMAESSIVHAVVETQDGQLLGVGKEVKVTIGGCGG